VPPKLIQGDPSSPINSIASFVFPDEFDLVDRHTMDFERNLPPVLLSSHVDLEPNYAVAPGYADARQFHKGAPEQLGLRGSSLIQGGWFHLAAHYAYILHETVKSASN
jgi:hypothetical protein